MSQIPIRYILVQFILSYFSRCSGITEQRYFQSEFNYRGRDRVIYQTSVRSHLLCVVLCAQSSDCAGTNFQPAGGSCELLASTCQGTDFSVGWKFAFKGYY